MSLGSRPPTARPAERPTAATRVPAWAWCGALCAALAALSLLGPHEPTYDPWAWLIWGREIAHGDFSTVAGPSWKPLPVGFTTVFAALGDTVAPPLWLVVARAGGLAAVVLAFRLASRAAGWAAGVFAAVALVLIDGFASLVLRGDSEGLLVALALGGIECHLAGRRRAAFVLALLAGLLRPEIWLFCALYGLWLVHRSEPGRRRTALAAVGAGGLALLLAWFVPEEVGSGRLLRGAARAREPVPGSPGQSAHPFLAVFTNSAGALPVPVYVFAAVAVVRALRVAERDAGDRLVLALALMSSVLMVTVALLAQAGFTGTSRYVILPAAMVCVLGGVGAVQLVRALAAGRVASWALAVAGVLAILSAPFVVPAVTRLGDQVDRVRDESRLFAALPSLLSAAGGRDEVVRCHPVYTDPFLTQLVAWHLHVHPVRVAIHPRPPGSLVMPVHFRAARDPRFPERVRTSLWVLRATCGRVSSARRR